MTQSVTALRVRIESRVDGSARVSGYDRLRAARLAIDDLLTSSACDAARWGEAVLDALSQLESALERHRDVSERPGGTLDEMVSARPGLANAARRQRMEHVHLLNDVVRVEETVFNDLETGTLDREKVRWQVGLLQDAVRRHMGRGGDLLHEAFFRDEGGEG